MTHDDRNRLVEQHIPLARTLARMNCRTHRGEFDEVVSVALLALIEAVDSWDGGKRSKLTTWIGLKVNARLMDRARQAMREAGWVRHWKSRSWVRRVTFTDIQRAAAVPCEAAQERTYGRRERVRWVLASCATRRERRMVASYLSGLPMKAVGRRHGVNESRTSQIIGLVAGRAQARYADAIR